MPATLSAQWAGRYRSPPPFTRNFKASNTTRLRRMMRSGGTLACHGHSGPCGYQGTAVANQFKLSPPQQLAGALKAAGVDAMCQNRFATGGTAEAIGLSDDRLAGTGGFVTGTGFTLGGGLIQTTTAGTLTYTPNEPTDKFRFWYAKLTGTSNFTYSLDGGTAVAINAQAGATGVAFVDINTTVGFHSLVITWVSGTAAMIAFASWDSTRNCINVMNWSARSTSIARESQVDQGYRAWPVHQTIVPDAIILCLSTNDAAAAGNTVAAYRALMVAYLDAKLPNSDVILETAQHVAAGFATGPFEGFTFTEQYQRYIDVHYELSETYDLPLIDIYRYFDDWGTFNSRGYYGDSAHLKGFGYGEWAKVEANALVGCLQAFG